MEQEGLAFARVCVEVKAGEPILEMIEFINERDEAVVHVVQVEWIPTQFSECKVFGYGTYACEPLGVEVTDFPVFTPVGGRWQVAVGGNHHLNTPAAPECSSGEGTLKQNDIKIEIEGIDKSINGTDSSESESHEDIEEKDQTDGNETLIEMQKLLDKK